MEGNTRLLDFAVKFCKTSETPGNYCSVLTYFARSWFLLFNVYGKHF